MPLLRCGPFSVSFVLFRYLFYSWFVCLYRIINFSFWVYFVHRVSILRVQPLFLYFETQCPYERCLQSMFRVKLEHHKAKSAAQCFVLTICQTWEECLKNNDTRLGVWWFGSAVWVLLTHSQFSPEAVCGWPWWSPLFSVLLEEEAAHGQTSAEGIRHCIHNIRKPILYPLNKSCGLYASSSDMNEHLFYTEWKM